jgi:hypothetical protein
MKHLKLFEEWINELKFADVDAFKAYNQKHKMRASTKVTVANKEMRAGDVGKEETKEDEVKEPKGTQGFIMPNTWDANKPSIMFLYKKQYYSFQYDEGWTETWPSASYTERMEKEGKVPFSAAIKAAEKALPGSAEKILIDLGLKKENPEDKTRKDEMNKQSASYDGSKEYPKIEIDPVNQEALKKLKKDEDTSEFLSYLIHDKSNVTANTEEVPEMTKVFKMTKDAEYKGTLYRGMHSSSPDDFKVGQTSTFGRYQSFSEDEAVAKSFSGQEKGQGVVLKVENPSGGFNYGGWLQQNMDSEDENLNFARYEREHLFDRNQKYEVIKKEKQGPFTVVHIKFI